MPDRPAEALEIDAMLARDAPLEDTLLALQGARDALAAEAPEVLQALEDTLYDRALDEPAWVDRKKASRALRYCLDIALTHDRVDGDTETSLLIKAIQLDPDDDALVIEYVRAASDSEYRYTDLSLVDVAESVGDPARARKLALLDTLAEYFCVRHYLAPTDNPVYAKALRTAFARAIARGADEAQWQATRAWFLAAVPHATIPEDLYSRYAS